MSSFVHIKSISDVYSFSNAKNSAHPLITVIRKWPKSSHDLSEIKFTGDLYFIALKPNVSGSFQYGRSTYDFQEGTMIFIGPGQVATFSNPKENEDYGWTILFHPDLIRQSELGKTIQLFSFFNYEANEALHLSDKEKIAINSLVDNIEHEIHQNIDKHSQEIIIQNLQTLLTYSQRFYDRQFYVRTNINKGIVADFERFLIQYFNSEKLAENGIPTLTDCGQALNVSGAYLSDLLRVETGKSAKDHIYRFLIEQAKTKLLNSADSVNEIAYSFGFEYPQNFSKLFKQKTGISPRAFRNLN